jgi:hypothetical protein
MTRQFNLVFIGLSSTKPTLSRNEKDVVDHKITQPHIYPGICHALRVGRSFQPHWQVARGSPDGDEPANNFFIYLQLSRIGAVG